MELLEIVSMACAEEILSHKSVFCGSDNDDWEKLCMLYILYELRKALNRVPHGRLILGLSLMISMTHC